MSLLSANLQAFVAVTRLQTVQAAARELGLSQTGVTQRLRTLESELKITLFIRSRRGMLLTQEGEALLRYCQAAQGLEGETLAKINGVGIEAEMAHHITGPSSIMRARVIPACIEVLKKFTQVRIAFQISDTNTWLDDLRSGRSHMAVVPPQLVANEMESKVLKPERYILVAPKAWSRRSMKDIINVESIVDFDESDTTTFDYLQKFGFNKPLKKQRHFLNNTESLVDAVKEGLGYGVLTTEFAKQAIERGELAVLNGGATLERAQALAWYPRHEMPTYFAAFIKAIK